MEMTCERCRSLRVAPRPRAWIGAAWTLRGWEALFFLVCASCGGPLPAGRGGESLLRKLLQLDRAGIGASGAPLLDRATETK